MPHLSGRRLLIALGLLLIPSGLPGQVGSPAGPVPPEFLQARRQRLLDLLGDRAAILSGARARELGEAYAQDSDFRQDNDFFYLTGIEAPGAWLVLNAGGSQAVLYLPPVPPGAQRWTGPVLTVGEEAERRTGISDVRSLDRLGEDLEGWLLASSSSGVSGAGEVFVSLDNAGDRETLEGILPARSIDLLPLEPSLATLRLVKDAEEIRRLRNAVSITGEAHREVWRVAKPGVAEFELEAVLEFVFRAQGAERVGFPSIVGSGPNSVILHYDENRRTLEEGELVVVDIGAEFGYYTADLTRTFPVGGRFSSRQKALYDLVLGALDAALSAVEPGATVADLDRAARSHLREASGELCAPYTCDRFLVHGVSHWLGMDVHDVGSRRTPLAPGMVLTLEPGLYLPEESLGIRIEDDVLVTESGFEVLSRDLPRTRGEIEGIMREEPRWIRLPLPGAAERRASERQGGES